MQLQTDKCGNANLGCLQNIYIQSQDDVIIYDIHKPLQYIDLRFNINLRSHNSSYRLHEVKNNTYLLFLNTVNAIIRLRVVCFLLKILFVKNSPKQVKNWLH